MTTLFKNAKILTMTGEPIFDGELAVEGNKICYVGKAGGFTKKASKEIDCAGNLLMPGFKNIHAHSAMVFLRSHADDLKLQDWLFKQVFPFEDLLQPDDIYWLSQLAFLEYLTSGITLASDMYFYPEKIKQAAEDFGFREAILLLPDGTEEENKKCIELYQKNNNTDLGRYLVGIHAEYTASEEKLQAVLDVIQKLKAPFYTHLSETEQENIGCKERRNGQTPTEFFESRGFFDYGGGLYHCCYVTERDLEILKKRNLSAITCPSSNLKLASGIAETEKMRKMGINLAIGTDGAASNNCLDMFREMFLVTGLQKVLLQDSAAMPAEEVLKMATVGGAHAVGMPDIDTLSRGKKADLIMIDLSQPNMQPVHDIVKNLVYAGSKSNVKMTMINGKILYKDGRYMTKYAPEKIYAECEKITRRITETH